MAGKNSTKPLDELLDEKKKEFESGTDREHDQDLDEMIWELGDYESQEPPQESREYKEEAPIEEDLVEKQMYVSRKKVYFREPVTVGDKVPVGGRLVEIRSVRVEIEGKDCEIVCGQIALAGKKKLETYCRKNDVTVSDIWYDNGIMTSIMGETWRGWYKADQFFHEMGLFGQWSSFSMNLYLDEEPAGRIDRNLITVRHETVPKPRPKRGFVAAAAGALNESKHIFRLDITGEFEPKKLVFLFKDLKNCGLDESLLTEVRYGDRVMDDSHQDYENEDTLDVKFLA